MIYVKIILILLVPTFLFPSNNDYHILEKTGLSLNFLKQDILDEISRLNDCYYMGGCKDFDETIKILGVDNSIPEIERLEKSNLTNENYYKNLFLGSLYFLDGKNIDIKKSRYFLQKASKHNFPASEYILGLTYMEKNCKESVPFFEKASYLGSYNASAILAVMNFYGICGKKQNLSNYFRLINYDQYPSLHENINLNWGGDLNKKNDYTQTMNTSIMLIRGSVSWYDKKYIIYQDTINFDKYHFITSDHSKIPRHSTRSLLLNAGILHSMLGNQGKSAVSLKGGSQDGVPLSTMWSNAGNKVEPYFQRYLIYNKKYTSSVKDAIYMNNSELWDTITVGDIVLISDKTTHHYTTIYNINREENYIEFIDQWTSDFFLKNALNNFDINAKIIDLKYGKKSLRIKKKDFFKVIVGFIASRNNSDTPEN